MYTSRKVAELYFRVLGDRNENLDFYVHFGTHTHRKYFDRTNRPLAIHAAKILPAVWSIAGVLIVR